MESLVPALVKRHRPCEAGKLGFQSTIASYFCCWAM